eukprot:TRINITY_DN63318_c0_g1_i1.p1 TRINITY_DN63318_c0_g1~~TRINITY_DN63318_c0_g1_i1.p1  ORF type:complete len:330 (+),score=88.60 TRINITY_DN63318_c0_g1_i1:37-1026(+)
MDFDISADQSEEGRRIQEAKKVIEDGTSISKAVFEQGLQKILNLAIKGYPRAMRSTLAKRNELLRAEGGGQERDQDAAVDKVKSSAAKVSEETKTWVLGLVPYVGLPSKILYPTWCAMRRVCLLAAIYGHPLDEETTKAKILHAFAGMRSVPIAELALEAAVQAVWSTFAGPAAFLPVGVLTSKVANVEGHVMTVVGKEEFAEGRQDVPEAEYQELLDGEPTVEDMLGLARDGIAYGIVRTWALGQDAALAALDARKRDQALAAALDAGKSGVTLAGGAATKAAVLARGAAAAAPGVAAAAPGAIKGGLEKGLAMGTSVLGGLTGKKSA